MYSIKTANIRINIPYNEYENFEEVTLSDIKGKVFYSKTKKVFTNFMRKIRKTDHKIIRIKKKDVVKNERIGRNVNLKKYCPISKHIALVPSLLNLLSNNHYDLSSKKLDINFEKLLCWEKENSEVLSLILVIDVSNSTITYLKLFVKLLNKLTDYFKDNDDKMGLIVLQGEQAKILNYPTKNYRTVLKNIDNLKPDGFTPLADGLRKSLEMSKLEKHKNPGSRSLILLLSDCAPEPIIGGYKDIFDTLPYREAQKTSKLFKQRNEKLLIINPAFEHKDHEENKYFPYEKLSIILEKNSGGKLVKIFSDNKINSAMDNQKYSNADIEAVESIFANI